MPSIDAARGNVLRAARIWGVVERIREETGSPLPAGDRLRYAPRVAMARGAVADAEDFDRALQEGHAMPAEQAIALALEEPGSYQ